MFVIFLPPPQVKIQVRGKVPTVAIDKTDGVVVYLSPESLTTTFSTSKSSEMCVRPRHPR
jgi:adenylyl cyclase-associated protein